MTKKKPLIVTSILVSTTLLCGCKMSPVKITDITVTFDYNGSGAQSKQITIKKGSIVDCPEDDPTWENHVFKGWRKTAKIDSPLFIFDEKLYQNTTIYASWEDKSVSKQYNITFDLNYDDAPEATTVKVNEGEKVNIPSTPKRENYVFSSWKVGKESTSNNFDFSTKIYSNMTLFASWDHQITSLKIDGEQNLLPKQTYTYKLQTKDGEDIPSTEVQWSVSDTRLAEIDNNGELTLVEYTSGGAFQIIGTYKNRNIILDVCIANYDLLNKDCLAKGQYIPINDFEAARIILPEKYFYDDKVVGDFKIPDSAFKDKSSLSLVYIPTTCKSIGIKAFENNYSTLNICFTNMDYLWEDTDGNQTYVTNSIYNGEQFSNNENVFELTANKLIRPTNIEAPFFPISLTVGETYDFNAIFTPSNVSFKDLIFEFESTLEKGCYEIIQEEGKNQIKILKNPSIEGPFSLTATSKVDTNIAYKRSVYIGVPYKTTYSYEDVGEDGCKISRNDKGTTLINGHFRIPCVNPDNQKPVVEIGNMYSLDSSSYYIDTSAIKYITIPNSAIKINKLAFQRYPNLKTVYFGKNLKIIEEEAFFLHNMSGSGESRGTLYLPSSLEEIGKGAFGLTTREGVTDKTFTKVVFEDATEKDTWTLTYTNSDNEEIIYSDDYAPSKDPGEAATLLKKGITINNTRVYLHWQKNITK